MKILAIGDIHMSTGNINPIQFARATDCIIIYGELTNYGSCRDICNIKRVTEVLL